MKSRWSYVFYVLVQSNVLQFWNESLYILRVRQPILRTGKTGQWEGVILVDIIFRRCGAETTEGCGQSQQLQHTGSTQNAHTGTYFPHPQKHIHTQPCTHAQCWQVKLSKNPEYHGHANACRIETTRAHHKSYHIQ